MPAATVFLVQSVAVASFAMLMKRRMRREPTAQKLAGRLIRTIEEERKHIARELHDDIGQRLSLVSVHLGSLNYLRTTEASDYESDLVDIRRELDSVIADVHNLSHSLHSSKLEHLGLEAALEELCMKISRRHDIQLDLQARSVPSDLNSDVALCFYRVAQEALNNVIKHSGSSRAQVTIALEGELLKMQVVDFGVGCAGAARSVGLGLATMEERLIAIAGTFSLDSKPGLGTTITAEAPIYRRQVAKGKEELAK